MMMQNMLAMPPSAQQQHQMPPSAQQKTLAIPDTFVMPQSTQQQQVQGQNTFAMPQSAQQQPQAQMQNMMGGMMGMPPPAGGMQPAPGQYAPWGDNPMAVPPPPGMPAPPGRENPSGENVPWKGYTPGAVNQYGGQQIAGAKPSQADYGSVQNYADAAHQNARRYLDPQQDMQNRRMQQDLINKGIDPNSAQGQEMQKMLGMQQADANNAAAFGAMQFGQGIQNQMAQQELANQGLAGDMQKALWANKLGASGQGLQYSLGQMQNQLGMAGLGVQQRGQDLQHQLGMGGLQNQRYGMDLRNQLGMGQLDLARQGQDFGQMMGLEGIDFRNRQYADQQQQYQDQITMALMGMTPVPGVTPLDPSGAFGNTLSSAHGNTGILGRLGII